MHVKKKTYETLNKITVDRKSPKAVHRGDSNSGFFVSFKVEMNRKLRGKTDQRVFNFETRNQQIKFYFCWLCNRNFLNCKALFTKNCKWGKKSDVNCFYLAADSWKMGEFFILKLQLKSAIIFCVKINNMEFLLIRNPKVSNCLFCSTNFLFRSWKLKFQISHHFFFFICKNINKIKLFYLR